MTMKTKRYLKHSKPVKASKRMLDRALRQQLAELRKVQALANEWCEEARRRGDMAARQRGRAESAEAEVCRLRELLEKMTQPMFEHAQMAMNPKVDQVAVCLPMWEISGRIDLGVSIDFRNLRMLARGNRDAWLGGIQEQFLVKCRQHAVKVFRLLER